MAIPASSSCQSHRSLSCYVVANVIYFRMWSNATITVLSRTGRVESLSPDPWRLFRHVMGCLELFISAMKPLSFTLFMEEIFL